MELLVAKELLNIEAVYLRPNDPFTWASGIKSPIYCDNRLVLSFPRTRTVVITALVDLIKNNYPDVEYIMGTATAGISHAALIANRLELPMGYVRSSSKNHGRTNQIEGKIIPNAKVVVVEDLISTGGSSIKVVDTLNEAGFEVLGVVAIFSYNLKAAKENFAKANLSYLAASNYDVLLKVATEMNYIKENDLNKLNQWKSDPNDESWINY